MLDKDIIKLIEDFGRVSVKSIDKIGAFMDELKAAGYSSHIDDSGQWLLVTRQQDSKCRYNHW